MSKMLLFSGQGSQYDNMSLTLLEKYSYLNDYLKIVNKKINTDIREILKSEKSISESDYMQICIFFASYIMGVVLIKENIINLKDFTFTAGHSLGEYAALCITEAIDYETALDVLLIRNSLTNEAIRLNQDSGLGMISVLGENVKEIPHIINSLSKDNRDNIFIANFNSDTQVVLSGTLSSLEEFKLKASEFGIKKVIQLNVKCAFHSNFMKETSIRFESKIREIEFKAPIIPIIMNYNAKITNEAKVIKENLIKNISNQVMWHQSMELAYNKNITEFVQISCKPVLLNMLKRVLHYKGITLRSYKDSTESIEIV